MQYPEVLNNDDSLRFIKNLETIRPLETTTMSHDAVLKAYEKYLAQGLPPHEAYSRAVAEAGR